MLFQLNSAGAFVPALPSRVSIPCGNSNSLIFTGLPLALTLPARQFAKNLNRLGMPLLWYVFEEIILFPLWILTLTVP